MLERQAGLSRRRLQLWPSPLPHPALHFLHELTELLGQLGVRPAGKLRRNLGGSRFGRRRWYGQRALEQVEGAGQRSLGRHGMDIGIRLSSPKPGTIPDRAAPASGCIGLKREPCPKGAASSQSRLHVVMLHTVRWDERWAKGARSIAATRTRTSCAKRPSG